jgi:hypothetical protein
MLTIQPDALGRITDHGFEAGPVGGDRFECILNVMTATDLAPYGLSFGFIGNERYVDE